MINAENVARFLNTQQRSSGSAGWTDIQILALHMWKSAFSAPLDLKIEWREVDTEAVGMPHKWGKRMKTQSH